MTPGHFRDWLHSEVQKDLDELKKGCRPQIRQAIRNHMRTMLSVMEEFDLVDWPKAQ